MMNRIDSKKFIFWFLIFLTVVNLTAITFIAVHIFGDGNDPKTALDEGIVQDEELRERFSELNMNFRRNSDTLIYHIRDQQVKMLKELENDNPDIGKLNAIADSIGNLHAQLKRETIRHFMAKRKYCNPDQRRRMFRFYQNAIAPDSAPTTHERKFRHRRRRGWNR